MPSRQNVKSEEVRLTDGHERARVWIRRLKNGLSVEHPVAGDELRAIKRYLHTRHDTLPRLFLSERGQPMPRQSINYLIGAAARRAGLGALHPHMLRHTCVFYLTNQGYDLRLIQDYLGHRDPKPLYADRRRSVRGHVGDVKQGRGQGREVNLALQDSYVVTGP